jgi:hypothetical protein
LPFSRARIKTKRNGTFASDERSLDGIHEVEEFPMNFNIVILQPLVALVAGILILAIPRLLNVVVAVYLILIGIAGLWPHLNLIR